MVDIKFTQRIAEIAIDPPRRPVATEGRSKRMETTYEDVLNHFVSGSREAKRRLADWESDPHKRSVIPFVKAATTTLAYRVTPDELERVCNETEHALGDVRRQRAESVARIRDWHPSFAFEHVLHHAAESLGRIPTYQDFRDFCSQDAAARQMLWDPAREQIRLAKSEGTSEATAKAAVRWRVGNAYLSFLREAYVLAVLRSAGIDARYHVLADVLFRVDCWVGRRCLSVYVRNAKYRLGVAGRKPLAARVLAEGRFEFADLALPIRREFGTVHLPDPDDVLAAFTQSGNGSPG